jgi:hypothetical protein
VQDPDPVGQTLGLIEVVRRQQDGRVVLVAKITHERLHLTLAADVQTRCRLVEEQQGRSGQERARDRYLLLHSTRELLERLVDPVHVDTESPQDGERLSARLIRPDAIETRGVHEVLHRRQLLEERRLDGDAVDEAASPRPRRLLMSRPNTRTSPSSGVRSVENMRISVDFPEPFAPSRP